MRIERNTLESERFGVAFARLYDPMAGGDLDRTVQAADDAGVEVISTRVSTDSLAVVHALEQCGFRIMDTLVYYRAELATTQHPFTASSSVIRAASTGEEGACARIAASAFHDYLGHYHADPRLDKSCADAAYIDWTTRLLCEPAQGQIALCAHAGSSLAGFLIGVPRDSGVSEIVLNAVDPAHQRQGCYGALLATYLKAVERRGDHATIISTQLQNYRVQRAWHRYGFVLFDSYHTLHRWIPET